MTALVSTPLIPISKKMGSHRGSQGIIYAQMLREDGWDIAANISGEHYIKDFNRFAELVVYHGNDWTGSVNLFGGLAKFPYIHNFVNFSKFQGPVHSLMIDMPDYAGMIRGLMDRPSSQGKINPEWLEADFDNLRAMQDRCVTIKPLPRKRVVAGDSHTTCMYRPGWDVNAVIYKTLYGALKTGLEGFVTFNRPLNELEEIEFYFGNIDVRHHLCRQPEPLAASRELARRYYEAVAGLDFDGPRRVYELLPIENPRRSLPKTGYYDGSPFFGSWSDRNDCRLAFRDELLRCEKEIGGVEVVLWVDKYLTINEVGELDFSSMEQPHSVHLSRAVYPYWRGYEWNHLEDPRKKGLDSFL
jgi:hypothetical protein